MIDRGPGSQSARFLYRSLDRVQLALVLFFLLLPGPFFGGVGFLSFGLYRAAVMGAFAVFLIKNLLYAAPERDRAGREATLFLALFIPFILYALAQGQGAGGVLQGRIGSLSPFLTFNNVTQLLVYGMAFRTMVDTLRTRERTEKLVFLFGIELAALVPYGSYVAQLDPAVRSMWHKVLTPMQATPYASFLNENYYGGFLAALAPLFMTSLIYYAKRSIDRKEWVFDLRAVEKLFFLMLLVMIPLSTHEADARAALFWQIAVVLLMALSLAWRRPALLALCILSVAGAVWLVIRFSPAFDPALMAMNFGTRSGMSQEVMAARHDFPIFGVGLGALRYAAPFYQITNVENGTIFSLPNHHLGFLIEAGPFGYFLFVAPFVFLIWRVIRRWKTVLSRWGRAAGTSSLFLLLTAVAVSFVDCYLMTPAIATAFLLHLALLCRCRWVELEAFPVDGPARRRISPAPAMLWLAAVLGTMTVAYSAWVDYAAESCYYVQSKTLPRLESAVRIQPDSELAWFELGQSYYEKGTALLRERKDFAPDIRKAREAFQKAIERAPTWDRPWTEIGRADLLLGERRQGLNEMGFGLRLIPANRDKYLHIVFTCARLSKSSPWAEERPYLRALARYWVGESRKLSNPLTADNVVYLKNDYYTGQLTVAQKALVQEVIREYDESLPSGSAARPA